MTQKIYAQLNPNAKSGESFKFKDDEEAGQGNSMFITKIKGLIKGNKEKSRMSVLERNDQQNFAASGGFNLTPVPEHKRGASFFVGISHNNVLPGMPTGNTSKIKKGSIFTKKITCEKEGCSKPVTDFVKRRCSLHNKLTTELRDSLLEEENIVHASMASAISKLYKTWSFDSDENSGDFSKIEWNFIWEDVHYKTVIRHTPYEDFLEAPVGEFTAELNSTLLVKKQMGENTKANKTRISVDPEDCSFSLDYLIEPLEGDEYGFVYSLYINLSPFEKCRLRWVRDKIKRQLERGPQGSLDISEMSLWKDFTTNPLSAGKDAIKAVFNFTIEGELNNITVDVNRKKVICLVNKNEIDLKNKAHVAKKVLSFWKRKPRSIAVKCGFKPCVIYIKKTDRDEREVDLEIDGVPFYVFKWIMNNL